MEGNSVLCLNIVGRYERYNLSSKLLFFLCKCSSLVGLSLKLFHYSLRDHIRWALHKEHMVTSDIDRS